MSESRRPPRDSLSARLWPLLAVNFFMADMQSGIGPFLGVFLVERGWTSGVIGTAMSIGNVAGMLITTPIGGFIDASHHKRAWVIVPGIAVVLGSSSSCFRRISGPSPLRRLRPRSPVPRSFLP
ncbi:hypothetical protein [Bradyrhizobium sp. SZCCHNR3078]|uniref:hypothetical protein n=2 Tax=Bradyrhizobium TaxID=374 RepID=UPI0028E5E751|nr:hypothetical protein [Bradyrhizobium sp. SZCCHNR3078]